MLELEIHDVAFGGAGVARSEGKVYFVPFTAPGDRIRAYVKKAKKKFAEAELAEVLAPSPDRVAPPCPYFGRCGGCAYQHLTYERQLALKQAQVEQTLRRVGRLEFVPMQPIIPSPHTYGFRNRIRVHVEGGQPGFFAHGSHELVPIDRCAIAQDGVNDALRNLRRSLVKDGDYTLVARERGQFFEQTNDGVAAELLALVESWTSPGQRLLIDAYCGAGFFAHRLAGRFEQVIGIEENEHAVAHARRQAGNNERYLSGDVAALLGDVLFGHDPERTTVILDPPAAGLSPRVVDILLARPPAEIIYVSCDPATLARDLGALSKRLRIEAVRPLDMFPQTAEVEVAVRLKS
jgi:tRNA/tmRNA/rRNA uracil-C5-methylase (TrmA/RlmC/RlmD family)